MFSEDDDAEIAGQNSTAAIQPRSQTFGTKAEGSDLDVRQPATCGRLNGAISGIVDVSGLASNVLAPARLPSTPSMVLDNDFAMCWRMVSPFGQQLLFDTIVHYTCF